LSETDAIPCWTSQSAEPDRSDGAWPQIPIRLARTQRRPNRCGDHVFYRVILFIKEGRVTKQPEYAS